MENGFISTVKSQFGKRFIDIMALVVAGIAVYITISQGISQKEIERINKQPLLVMGFSKVDSGPMKGIHISNLGFGPAIIKSFKIYLNENDFNNDEGTQEWDITGSIFDEYYFEKLNYLEKGFAIGEKDVDRDFFLIGTTTDSTYLKPPNKSFYFSKTAIQISKVIIEIEYTSMNPQDNFIYYIRYSESLSPSIYRETRMINQ